MSFSHVFYCGYVARLAKRAKKFPTLISKIFPSFVFLIHTVIQPTKISIVLPCYNPQQDWAKNVVAEISRFIVKTGADVELIIVNDGSSSNWDEASLKLISDQLINFRSHVQKINAGKGSALRKGVSLATNELIIYTDIDFPYSADSLLKVYHALTEGSDVVLGHRGKNYYKNTPWFRKFISKFLRWTLKTFLRLPTDDSQCGLKGFNRKGAVVFSETRINRFLFDLEFIKLCARRKLNIKKVPVELKPHVVFSKVHFGVLIRESYNFIRVLFRK